MSNEFILAWCREHHFTENVAAIISYLSLSEKDLIEKDIDEDTAYNTVYIGDDCYEVYGPNNSASLTEEEEDLVKNNAQMDSYSPSALKDYIDWDKYFEDYPIELGDVLDLSEYDDYTFCYDTFYIKKED
jgi:hypothetical protein